MSHTLNSKKTISILESMEPTKEHTLQVLKTTLEKIAFLETIYITGEDNHHYSEEFSDAAYRERQDLCKISSWAYSRLRDTFNMACNRHLII